MTTVKAVRLSVAMAEAEAPERSLWQSEVVHVQRREGIAPSRHRVGYSFGSYIRSTRAPGCL